MDLLALLVRLRGETAVMIAMLESMVQMVFHVRTVRWESTLTRRVHPSAPRARRATLHLHMGQLPAMHVRLAR
jgi:hypothetical protein